MVVRLRGILFDMSPEIQVLVLAKYLSMASLAGCDSIFARVEISCKSASNRSVLWYVIFRNVL